MVSLRAASLLLATVASIRLAVGGRALDTSGRPRAPTHRGPRRRSARSPRRPSPPGPSSSRRTTTAPGGRRRRRPTRWRRPRAPGRRRPGRGGRGRNRAARRAGRAGRRRRSGRSRRRRRGRGPGQHQHVVSLVGRANENRCRFRATVAPCPSCSRSSPSSRRRSAASSRCAAATGCTWSSGFAAGVMLGLVAFDLLPELFELSDAVVRRRAGGDGGLRGRLPAAARRGALGRDARRPRGRVRRAQPPRPARRARLRDRAGRRTRSSTASASGWRSRSTTPSGTPWRWPSSRTTSPTGSTRSRSCGPTATRTGARS